MHSRRFRLVPAGLLLAACAAQDARSRLPAEADVATTHLALPSGSAELRTRRSVSSSLQEVADPPAGLPAEPEADFPCHNVALFGGIGFEDKTSGPEEHDFAVGVGYIHRFSRLVGLGFGVEVLGPRVQREVLIGAPLSLYPWQGLRLAVGPGLEFARGEQSFALRVGAGYEVELGRGWALAPELFYDFLERGERTLVTGVSFSRSW